MQVKWKQTAAKLMIHTANMLTMCYDCIYRAAIMRARAAGDNGLFYLLLSFLMLLSADAVRICYMCCHSCSYQGSTYCTALCTALHCTAPTYCTVIC